MQNAGAIQTKFDVASKARPEAGHKIQKFYPPGSLRSSEDSWEDPASSDRHPRRHCMVLRRRRLPHVSPPRAAILLVRLWSKFPLQHQLTESTSLLGLLFCLVDVLIYFYDIIKDIYWRIFRKSVFSKGRVSWNGVCFSNMETVVFVYFLSQTYSSFFSRI